MDVRVTRIRYRGDTINGLNRLNQVDKIVGGKTGAHLLHENLITGANMGFAI